VEAGLDAVLEDEQAPTEDNDDVNDTDDVDDDMEEDEEEGGVAVSEVAGMRLPAALPAPGAGGLSSCRKESVNMRDQSAVQVLYNAKMLLIMS
jgi:hypothetical protein